MGTAIPAKQSATVRISELSRHRLRELAAQGGEPMQMVTDKVLETYRRQKFWGEMDTVCAAIQNDPEALAAEKAEINNTSQQAARYCMFHAGQVCGLAFRRVPSAVRPRVACVKFCSLRPCLAPAHSGE